MKFINKIILISLALFSFVACEDNLEDDNIPAIQAVRNGEFFKSLEMVAVANTDGSVTITGLNRLERLDFNLESSAPGTYPLSAGSPNEATYTFINSTDIYSTNEGAGNGQVVIAPGSPAGTLTGTFSFVSYLPSNADSLYMRKGVIFQVPFGDAIGTGTGGGGSTSNSFAVDIDGTAFNPAIIQANIISNTLTVAASSSSGGVVSLFFPSDITVGTYTIGGATSSYYASYLSGTSNVFSDTGTLTITAVDTAAQSITGTFDFTTGPPDNFMFTNGEFTVNY